MIYLFKSDYWKNSKDLSLSLVLVTPLWLLYEFLAFQINAGWNGSLRTGIDYLIIYYFQSFNISSVWAFFLPTAFLIFYFARKLSKRTFVKSKGRFWGLMILEGIFYAALFGLVVGYSVNFILNAKTWHFNQSKAAAFVINLGSGVYEEIVFRLFIISGITFLLKRFNKLVVYSNAIILSASLFAYFHYMGIFAENFELSSFMFRFTAGVVFSIIYIFRGLGISVYTHSIYNIFLMMR